MSKDQSGNIKKLVVGTTVAAAAGYVAGILTAPKSGKETRGDIKAAALKKRADAEKELKHLQTELDKLIQQGKAKATKLSGKAKLELDTLVEKAKTAKEKTAQVIGVLRNGDAKDADLKTAVTSAKSSIEHLRAYIKK
jgi:gas vesicle protein